MEEAKVCVHVRGLCTVCLYMHVSVCVFLRSGALL